MIWFILILQMEPLFLLLLTSFDLCPQEIESNNFSSNTQKLKNKISCQARGSLCTEALKLAIPQPA